ncbi:LuxR C-terminal-related transcriptional regulator [Nocardia sp. alder85J]|uniref:LuxR C-terminal-related transcriptional regulator n=1 Tax=Nocardia sp. alder85J TaxID=2862949 RepID=UPI001CD650CB|nr:response regulator transcription factor [Nocardia sp. alder85J]MCX4094167.1 response regulator transcription factor [Nocardia sp. alder85J]
MRVVIAEDLALLRDGLTRLLHAHDIEVAAALADVADLPAVLERERPDLVILDVRMPPTFTNEGLVAAIAARRRRPDLPVLVLSQYVEQLYARELMSSGEGALGYLLKDRVAHIDMFLDAIRRVAAGGTVLDPKVVAAMVTHRRSALARLSNREREVLSLMAEGRSNGGIAAALVLSPQAVSKHINNIFTKLDLLADTDGNRRVLAVLEYLQDDPAPGLSAPDR